MSTFRLYLWREWREHRFALLALVLALPLVTTLVTWPLTKRQVGDPLLHNAVAAGFALVLMAVVGGELLGSERRGSVHGWLERVPAGLEAAFRAKLAFLVLVLVGATLAGFATADVLAFARGTPQTSGPQPGLAEPLLVWALVAALGTWTFAASTWTQRGGLALMAATLVLCVVGYPVWNVVTLGYSPRTSEWLVLGVWLVPSAVLGAALGYVRGTRRGRGPGWAALLGLAPLLPLGVGTGLWSAERLTERERFEPGAQDFRILGAQLSHDGRTALGVGEHRVPRWRALPQRVVRIELESGKVERLGDYQALRTLSHLQADGLPVDDEVLIPEEDGTALLFSLADGSLREGRPAPRDVDWKARGLGAYIWSGDRGHFRDPFRARDYPRNVLPGEYGSEVLIRPGRWLVAAHEDDWEWFDPDSGEFEPVAWPSGAKPLVVLPDGGVLVRAGSELRLEQPELGQVLVVDTHGLRASTLLHGSHGRRLWGAEVTPWHDEGPIALQSNSSENSVLVIDPLSGQSRRIEPGELVHPIGRLDAQTLLVTRWKERYSLARLDLSDGSLEPIVTPAGDAR